AWRGGDTAENLGGTPAVRAGQDSLASRSMSAQYLKINLMTLFLAILFPTIQARAQAPKLTIDRSRGVAQLGIRGEPGGAYTVEATADALDSSHWEPLITAVPTNQIWSWLDSA